MVEIRDDGDEVSNHCNPKHDHRQWCEAPSFLAINRSTMIPMPTETEWKEQSLPDPDIAYLIQKIKANEVVSYVMLDNKGYYKQWVTSKLEVENDILYQYEHPKATNIRQLKRCVVPVS
jgi:hypothetical protein